MYNCTHNNQAKWKGWELRQVVSAYPGLLYLQGAASCINVPATCVYHTHAVSSSSVCSDKIISLSIHFCL